MNCNSHVEMSSDYVSPIYDALANHQQRETAWKHQTAISELLTWAERFNFEIKIEVPTVTLAIDRVRSRRCLSHYRCGHNGFGLRREIVISQRHVEESVSAGAWFNVLATLLHELLHAWQDCYGKCGRGNYHNREFRRKAADLGLIVDERGVTQLGHDTLFTAVLARYEVNVPFLAEPAYFTKRQSKIKLHLWTCGCTKVRIGRSNFNATCLDCCQRFEFVE